MALGVDGKGDKVAEGVLRVHSERDSMVVCHFGLCLVGSIEHRSQTIIGSSHHEMLAVVRPSHTMIVLAAS